MALTVDVTGPAPWGFRISGGRDFHTPIIVTKVRAVFRRQGASYPLKGVLFPMGTFPSLFWSLEPALGNVGQGDSCAL